MSNLYINPIELAKYYEINGSKTLKDVCQMWHSMWLLELVEVGWGDKPDDGLTADPSLPFMYSTAAFRSRFKVAINNLDLLTEQTINGGN